MGWVNNRLTERFNSKVGELLAPGADRIGSVGLPRYSVEQSERVKGATKYLGEVVDTYPELEPFRGITEVQIRAEGVDIWVRDLAPDDGCVRRDEHVGYVMRRGDAVLAMIDSSGVKLYLDMPGLGLANGANQLMIQVVEAIRCARSDGQPPRMLMPAADDREGRQSDQIDTLQKYANEVGVEWLQGGKLIDWTDLGTRVGKTVHRVMNQEDADKKKLASIEASIVKMENGENGQLAEPKLPFPLQYRRDQRGRPVKGPHNGTVIDHTDDPARIKAVQTLVRSLSAKKPWSQIGEELAEIDPRLPTPDEDGQPRYFSDTDDWAATAKSLVITKSHGRPRTPKYLFANLEMWRTGRWPTIRRVGDALQGHREIAVRGRSYPIVSPERGERYIELTALWDRWPTDPQTGESLERYGLTEEELAGAYAELVRRHQQGRGEAQAGPRTHKAYTKMVGDIPFQPVSETLELRTYANGSGRHAALVVTHDAPGGNRNTATRVGKVPVRRLVRQLAVTAENTVADLLDQARTFTLPAADGHDRDTAQIERELERIYDEITAKQKEAKEAAALAVRATTDTARDAYNDAVDDAGKAVEKLTEERKTKTRELAQLRSDVRPRTEHLRLADVIAIGQKTEDGYAPSPLARLFLGLFDWSSWRWRIDADPDTRNLELLHATVDLLVPLTDGTVRRLPLETAVRPSKGNAIDPADRVAAIMLGGSTLDQLAVVENVTRASLVASTSRWLSRTGCHIPLAALSNPHPAEQRAIWAIASGANFEDLDPDFVEAVRVRYFTARAFAGRTWTNTPGSSETVAQPHDHTLAQTVINSLLRLRDPMTGAAEEDIIAAVGCTRTEFRRQVLGWSSGRGRLERPSYVQRTEDGRITPIPCVNNSCLGRRPFASVVRLTPMTWPYGVVCPACGHVPDAEMRHPALPPSYREPTTDAMVSLSSAVPTMTVPQIAEQLDSSEFLIGAILEEQSLPYSWDRGSRRVPQTILPKIKAALASRNDRAPIPEGTLTVPQAAEMLGLTHEQVRHFTRKAQLQRLATTTDTGGWLYSAAHIEQVVAAQTLAGYRHDSIGRPEFAELLRVTVRELRSLEEGDPDFPAGWQLRRGWKRWTLADARTYAGKRRASESAAETRRDEKGERFTAPGQRP